MSLFYLLFVPASIALALELRHVWHLRRHDTVLFGFRRLRSDVLRFISENVETVTREDYAFARQILLALDNVERARECNRVRFFNLRAFVRFLKQFSMTADQIARMPQPTRQELRALEARFGAAVLREFHAYTPFIGSEIVARLVLSTLIFVCKLPARLGHRAAKRAIAAYRGAIRSIERQVELVQRGTDMHYA